MNKNVAAILLGGLVITASAQAQQTFVGVWEVRTHVPDVETAPLTWTVTEVDGEYQLLGEGGDETINAALGMPISVSIEFDGTAFTMTTVFQPQGVGPEFTITNTGVIDGDTFEGTTTFDTAGEFRLTGERQ